jgi:hypothetical protein
LSEFKRLFLVNFAEPFKPTIIPQEEMVHDIRNAKPKTQLILEAWVGIVGLRSRRVFRKREQSSDQKPLTDLLKKLERKDKKEASQFILNAAKHSDNYFYATRALQNAFLPVYQEARAAINGDYFQHHQFYVGLVETVQVKWEPNFINTIQTQYEIDESETDNLKLIWQQFCFAFVTHLVMVFVQELEDSEEKIKLAIRVALKSVKVSTMVEN